MKFWGVRQACNDHALVGRRQLAMPFNLICMTIAVPAPQCLMFAQQEDVYPEPLSEKHPHGDVQSQPIQIFSQLRRTPAAHSKKHGTDCGSDQRLVRRGDCGKPKAEAS